MRLLEGPVPFWERTREVFLSAKKAENAGEKLSGVRLSKIGAGYKNRTAGFRPRRSGFLNMTARPDGFFRRALCFVKLFHVEH